MTNAWGMYGPLSPEEIAKLKNLPYGQFRSRVAADKKVKKVKKVKTSRYEVTAMKELVRTLKAKFVIASPQRTVSSVAWSEFNARKDTLVFEPIFISTDPFIDTIVRESISYKEIEEQTS